MGRVRIAIGAALLALMVAAAPADAGQITRPDLSGDCNLSGEQFAAAFACDPGGGKQSITLALGSDRYTDRRGIGIGSIGVEPLLPGETATVDWAHPSREAELGINSASPFGTQWTVFALSWRPKHVEVTARPDGSLELHTAARSAVIPAPTPSPPIDWQPRSARQAAARILAATDHIEGSYESLDILCAALAPTVLPAFGVPTAPFPDPFHANAADPCIDGMGFAVEGKDSLPTGTHHRDLSVRTRGTRAILTTTLSHRYSEERRQVRARVLLEKDSQGIWRLATLEPLLPLTLLEHPRPFSDAELAATYRQDRRRGAKAEGRFEREFGAIRSATVAAGTAAPCSVTMVPADVGSESFSNEGDLDTQPRHPEQHADVDLTAAGSAAHCVAIQTAAPLPARFNLKLDNTFEIDVADGKVVAFTGDPAGKPVPLPGISASLNGNELVLHTPFSLARISGVEIDATSWVDLTYGDFAFTQS